jgi:hypothetical protein
LLQRGGAGVFFSRTPGIVAWIIPRTRDLSEYKTEARQFSLDSDLILGAVGEGEMVAILGRERVAPVSVLPPLRTETILLLASVHDEELAQSYERNNFAAGKFDDEKNLDWAPIFLSNELIDTEFGSLLDITDQLLKGWSQHGDVTYENFPYPKPVVWPFPKPLDQMVKVDSITFNWNTKGAAYRIDGDESILAINRTGALPVSYMAEGEASSVEATRQLGKHEITAYDYFATLHDPNLARVVQYATLYQVIRRFRLHATAPQPIAPSNHEPLRGEIQRILNTFASIDVTNLEATMDKLKAKDFSLIEAMTALEQSEHIEELGTLIAAIRDKDGAPGMERVAQHLSSPREHANQQIAVYEKLLRLVKEQPKSEQEKLYEQLTSAKYVVRHLGDAGKTGPLSSLSEEERDELAIDLVAREFATHSSLIRFLTGTSVRFLKDAYERDVLRPDVGWIHTPSIVVSSPGSAQMGAVGGHNIGSAVTRFRPDVLVKTGTVHVIREGTERVIIYSAADEALLPQLSELVGRVSAEIPAPKLQDALNEIVAVLPKPSPIARRATLGLSDSVTPSADRGLQRRTSVTTQELFGYRTSARPALSDSQFINAASSRVASGVIVERKTPTSIFVYHGNSGHVVEATDTAGAMEALTGIARNDTAAGMKTRIVFRKGFTEDEAIGYIDSLRTKLATGERVELEAGVEIEGLSPEHLARVGNVTDFDYSAVKIMDDASPILDGDFIRHKIDLEIPSKVSTRLPLHLRIRLYLKRGLGSVAERLTEAKRLIADTIVSFVTPGSGEPVMRVAGELRRQLTDHFGKDAVRIHVIEQATDFLITDGGALNVDCTTDRLAA